MPPAQWLLLVSAVVWMGGLARAIRRALEEVESSAPVLPLTVPLLGPWIALIAHYADGRLPIAWRAERMTRLLRAGLEPGPTPPQWFAVRCVGAGLGATAGVALGLWGSGVAWAAPAPLALTGWLAPELWLRRRIRRRLRQIESMWPLYLEMLLAGLEAGLELPLALQLTVRAGPPGPIRVAWARALREVPRGSPPGEILRGLCRRLHEPATRAAFETIVRAERDGVGPRRALRDAIARQAASRLAQAEQCLGDAPGHLALPLLTCFLPGLLLLLAGPAALPLLPAY
jgi:tight adherence protein C